MRTEISFLCASGASQAIFKKEFAPGARSVRSIGALLLIGVLCSCATNQKPVVTAPTETKTAAVEKTYSRLPDGEYSVLIQSEPIGAMIVVNGIPVGKAPRRLVLPGTAQGFSRSPVSIKARFVAETSTEESRTVETELTPLDRLPPAVVFTPTGVQRRL